MKNAGTGGGKGGDGAQSGANNALQSGGGGAQNASNQLGGQQLQNNNDPFQSKHSREGDRRHQTGSQISGGPSAMLGSKIAQLQETGTFYAKKIEAESAKLEDLERQIRAAEEELEEKRKALMDKRKSQRVKHAEGICETDAFDPIVLQNKIRAITAKIETQKTKLNEAYCKNNRLKESVNHLRREKRIYEDIRKMLETDIQRETADLNAMKQKIQTNKDWIERSKHDIDDLKRQSNLEKQHFEREFAAVFKILDEQNRNERIAERFPNRRSKQGTTGSEILTGFGRLNSSSPSPGRRTAGGASVSEDPESPTKTRKIKEKRTQHKQAEETLQRKKEEVARYEEILQKLKEETSSENMNQIFNKFIAYEDENHALFNYINTLRDESEALSKQKKALENEVKELEKRPLQSLSDPKTQKFIELKNEIAEMKKKRQKHESELQSLEKTVNSLKISIPIMFERIGCNSQEYTRELTEEDLKCLKDFKEIQESHLLQFLGLIEKRTNDLLQLYNEAYNTKGEPKNKMLDDSNVTAQNQGGGILDKKDEMPEHIASKLRPQGQGATNDATQLDTKGAGQLLSEADFRRYALETVKEAPTNKKKAKK